MKIAIIVAMDKELALMRGLLGEPVATEIHGLAIWQGAIGPHRVWVMKCGIGKVNAAMGTVEMIDAVEPDLVINTGVAGGAGAGTRVLDVVMATGVAYHDFWCIGEEWGRVPEEPRVFETVELPLAEGSNLHRGLIASGDLFITKPEEVDFIRSVYADVKAVDMESAAIGHVCHSRGVKFACIRVLSDTPGEAADNSAQYEEFWADAPKLTFAAVRSALEAL